MHDFSPEFYALIEEKVPTAYFFDSVGGKNLQDVKKVDKDINWLIWAGGEYIGGSSAFFKSLYDDILTFKEDYWAVVHDGLFHIGDEMLTSIALSHLRRQNICPVNVTPFKVIYRYWSVSESQRLRSYEAALIHLPGDKTFLKVVNLTSSSIQELMRGYETYHKVKHLKGIVKKILHP